MGATMHSRNIDNYSMQTWWLLCASGTVPVQVYLGQTAQMFAHSQCMITSILHIGPIYQQHVFKINLEPMNHTFICARWICSSRYARLSTWKWVQRGVQPLNGCIASKKHSKIMYKSNIMHAECMLPCDRRKWMWLQQLLQMHKVPIT